MFGSFYGNYKNHIFMHLLNNIDLVKSEFYLNNDLDAIFYSNESDNSINLNNTYNYAKNSILLDLNLIKYFYSIDKRLFGFKLPNWVIHKDPIFNGLTFSNILKNNNNKDAEFFSYNIILFYY